ncbi:MAG: hypothetical protein ACYTG1_01790 [Planctomycetota bacterium]|jgi:hypothetical protein
MTPRGHIPAIIVSVAAGLPAAGAGGAADGHEPVRLETRPPGVVHLRPDLPRGPRRVAALGAFASVQVNLDADHLNIVGDAANEPSIAVDPALPNRIAIGWRQFDTIGSSFRQAGYSFSRDGGRTWAPLQIIEPGTFRSDPVLTAGLDGTFHYLSLRFDEGGNGVVNDLFSSPDGGDTWPSKAFAFGGDKAWLAIDTTGGPGTGNLYQAWNTAGNNYFPAQFNRRLAGGSGWQAPVAYLPIGQVRPVFGEVAVGPDGEVYVAGAQNAPETTLFWVVRSVDAGLAGMTPTFTAAVVDLGGALVVGGGPNPAGLLGQVEVVVDHSDGPRRGDVYVLCSVDPPGPDPMDVHLVRSTDGGATFGPPVRVNDDPPDPDAWQWFGTLSVAPGGRLDAVWNDTRTSGEVRVSTLFHASSADGGVTWSPNTPLSPAFDSHLGWPMQAKLGDYYDMVSDDVGADLAWAATFNGEQDVYYLRIGDRDCNGNGVGDADDLAAGVDADCNRNGVLDGCDLATGTEDDENANGIPDRCECPGDADLNGAVDAGDVLGLLEAWGTDEPVFDLAPPGGDGVVDVSDLLVLLATWGPCL